MRLTLRNDYSFTLTITGYQFPSLKDKEYDSNWLNIRIDVQHPEGNWKAVDPALLTYEVQEIADWFRDLAAGRRDKRSAEFLEPGLALHVESNEDSSEVLKVKLAYGFRPPWSKSWEDEFELTFPLATINLVKAAEALERELARYPQRTSR
ncbi:MAG TPA: hypothetical protein VF290_02310 [Pyrinomonadaceae bacterium]